MGGLPLAMGSPGVELSVSEPLPPHVIAIVSPAPPRLQGCRVLPQRGPPWPALTPPDSSVC